MPRKYRKLCIECSNEFESENNRHCPRCGGDDWRFIDEDGKQRNFFAEEMAKRNSAVREIQKTIRKKSGNTSTISFDEAGDLLRRFGLSAAVH